MNAILHGRNLAMSKEIKTRQIHKDIKVINKAVVGTDRVREAYVRTKESAEQTQSKASPEEYAGDKITQGTQSALKETVHQMGKACLLYTSDAADER